MLPSLAQSGETATSVSLLRWLAYPLSVVALLLAVYALTRALLLASAVTQQIYPRSWI